MNIKKIEIAEQEARRFLERVEAVKSLCTEFNRQYNCIDSTKETGALRRSSMDLTRALADMRKYE